VLNIDLDGLEEWDAVSKWNNEARGYITVMTLVDETKPLKINYTLVDKDGFETKAIVDDYLTDKQRRDANILLNKEEYGEDMDNWIQHRDMADLKKILTDKVDELKSTTPVSVKKTVPEAGTESIVKEKEVITTNTTVTVEKEPEPKSEVITVRLAVNFTGNRKSFSDEDQAAKVLTPILKYLKQDPRNSVTLYPLTAAYEGEDLIDWGGILGDGDFAEDLVELRGETLTNWFIDGGANPDQVNISIDSRNFSKAPLVIGKVTVHE